MECNEIIGNRKVTIISGGARGADSLAVRYAKDYGHNLKVMPADWDKHGKSAGYIRNSEMLKLCDGLIAFWDGESTGTGHMIEIARKAGKEVHVIRYNNKRLHISKEWDKVIDLKALERRMRMDEKCRNYDRILPAHEDILNAFKYIEFSDVNVVIIGQDPYPGRDREGKPFAHGLAFSSLSKEVPASLKNVFKEIDNEYGHRNRHADLTAWTGCGVLLMNMNLTVIEGEPGSHTDTGWEQITTDIISKLSRRGKPTVFMLWGKKAQSVEEYIKESEWNLVLKAAHPSPMSADKGFFGCNHFELCNEFLELHGLPCVDWSTDEGVELIETPYVPF